jgi:hypothetical protein
MLAGKRQPVGALPSGQVMWLEVLESFRVFPPLQRPPSHKRIIEDV